MSQQGYQTGYAAYDAVRDVMRGPVTMPMPGPASEHAGGYRSAYHTPLPSAMPGGLKNSWRDDFGVVSQGVRAVNGGGQGVGQNGARPETANRASGGRLVFPEAELSRRQF